MPTLPPPSTIRQAAFWAVAVGLAVAAAVYLVLALSWLDRPYPGFKVRVDRVVELQLPPASTGARAGLMPGDRVVAIDGRPLTSARALYAHAEARPVGTPVAYDLERPLPSGQTVRLGRVVATQRHDARLWASTFLALWLTGLCFLVLGVVVSVLKPGDPLARANWAFHAAGAAACISVFDQSTTQLSPLQDTWRLLPWLVAMAYAHLALCFAGRSRAAAIARRVNLGAGLALGLVLVGCHQANVGGFWVTFGHLAYIGLAEAVWIAVSLAMALGPGRTALEKGQGAILLVGTVLSTVPALVVPQAHALGLQLNLDGLENCALPIWLVAIAYAIARHQLFDISPFIRRSVPYLAAAAVLTVAYGVATTATEAVLGRHANLPGLVGTLVVAFAFAPVRDGIQRWLDVRFFRGPYRLAEVVGAFTRAAQETAEPSVLMQAYLDALERALAPTRVAIVLARPGPVPAAARHWPDGDADGLRARLASGEATVAWRDEALRVWPMTVQSHALGHVLVGPKKSGLAYTALDRALLAELTQSLAVWLHWFDRFETARLQSQQLEALERSEAMQGQFLNIVSHELKIPLSVMMSSLNILKAHEADHDARTANHLGRMRRSLTHLVGLVGDLLNAGQLQSGHFQLRTAEVDVAGLAAETVAEMRPLAEAKGQTLTLAVGPDVPALEADATRVAQVLRNLIHNAVRYTPARGRLHVAVAAAGDGLRCAVTDDGPGVDAAARAHLFERFGQAHAPSGDRDQGVGLGLFISRAIVEAHGGLIGVESAPGAGSTFWFELPARARAAEPATRAG